MTWPIREYRLSASDLEHMLAAAKFSEAEGADEVVIDVENILELLEIALALAMVREHKHYKQALGTIELDRSCFDLGDGVLASDEDNECVSLQDALWELLTGKPYGEAFDDEPVVERHLRLVRNEE